MAKETISIAMCTYNGSAFIEEQLNSLASQTHLPHEVIVFDDLSTDNTAELLSKFAKSAPFPFRFQVNQERLGYRKNFMKAAAACTGGLIAFCDQDDIWHPTKLAAVSEAFLDPQVLMVHHNARLVRADGEPFGRINEDGAFPPLSDALSENPWHYCLGFTQTFRRCLADFNGLRERFMGEDEHEWTAHDQWISFLSSALGRVAYINEGLVDYRQHGRNTYGFSTNLSRKDVKYTIKQKLYDYRDYNILTRVCARRAEVLREIAQAGVQGLTNAGAAGDWYSELAKLYQERADSYCKDDLFKRAVAWIGLIKGGAYDKRRGRYYFTFRSAVRDFILGVIFARLKYGTAPTVDFSLHVNART